jgi:hypothetical protein
MTTSLSNHRPSAPPVDGIDEYPADGVAEDPYDGDSHYEARLRGLSHQQLADRLNWLSWYQPGIFTAVMDYGQFSDDLAEDADPANPDPDPHGDFGDLDVARCAADPVPVCAYCGSEIGIFVKFGLQWRHYRGGEALGQAEIFDPGHEPELAWRLPAPPPTGI